MVLEVLQEGSDVTGGEDDRLSVRLNLLEGEIEKLRKKHEGLLEQLAEAEQKVRELNRKKVHENFAVTKLTRELLDEYVESIEVHPGDEVKIEWK